VSFARAADLVTALAEAGVATWCVCPGGRNAPLVVVLERARGITTLAFHDERSAAFFAVGRARATGAPAAVVTTSGTAAAELLPAAVEAYYAGVPLVLVTADRPPHYRGTGSPQTIDQVDLFGDHAPTVFDGAADGDRLDLSEWDGRQPIHVNICFDEPLAAGAPPTLDLALGTPTYRARTVDPAPLLAMLRTARRPVVLLGPLDAGDHPGVRAFLARLGAPVYAEAASGLREDPALAHLRIASGERALRSAGFDAVLRIGGVPTLRLWRDLESRLRDVPVCSVHRTPFPGLTRGTHLVAEPGTLLDAVTPEPCTDAAWRDALLAHDHARLRALDALWTAHPRAEPAMVQALSALIPPASLVYLGNSLPIREWDLAAVRAGGPWAVGVNRGANGIDGQLSTFFGMCAPGREHWAIVGDLTALYDLGAPWVLPRLATGPIRIVVVNNGGGQIFRRLFPWPELRNEHTVTFERWAAMWSLAYRRWDEVPGHAALPDRVVIELTPDAAATDAFWQAYDGLD
jgi:2-succinyl-5-enolpyruvyl-6-hydroxy-3-cyclohexene-1-carboxylate synthase